MDKSGGFTPGFGKANINPTPDFFDKAILVTVRLKMTGAIFKRRALGRK
jgi:hypothetical protein